MKTRLLPLFLLLALLPAVTGAQSRPARTVRPPVISPPGGTYKHGQKVTIVIRAQRGCSIIYSFTHAFPGHGNGTLVNAHVATLPLPAGDSVLRAVAVRPGMPASQPTVAKYFRAGN